MSSDQTDLVQYFLEDMDHHGRTSRTIDAYERVLRSFEAFLSGEDDTSIEGATYRDCTAWINSLRAEKSESTVASYASYLHRFYGYMTQVGMTDENPMTLVVEEMNESIDVNPSRRDVSLSAMRDFVGEVTHPLHKAVIVTLLKTGMRAGEICNLDSRDIRLEEGPSSEWRPQLDNKGDSIYVAADRAVGEQAAGERRTASNKRQRATIIPIDEELRHILLRWLLVRPDTISPAEPLFVHTSRRWGQRLTPDSVHHMVTQYASNRGWYRDGGGADENVTPHYFRHFFTTHLRDRTGDRGIVKYLRGDVASDIIDTYTHNWGNRVCDVYEENIYSVV